jgi:23S rRNA (cytidine1920-2'-O)/16S rRNA (cytidine1409-2'-O)-methyltransferase
MSAEPHYVSRAGSKLEHALREFGLDPKGKVCADFGCNVGGFTDCLLQHGASKVYSIDTGYGVLAWKLRQDSRVVVMERANALHVNPPEQQRVRAAEQQQGLTPAALPLRGSGPCDLITIDLGWTPQRLAIPAALRWLNAGGRIITLIKPHYELTDDERDSLLVDGSLSEADAQRIFDRTIASLPSLGVIVLATTRSPIRGGKSSRGRADAGNIEFLALLEPAENQPQKRPG